MAGHPTRTGLCTPPHQAPGAVGWLAAGTREEEASEHKAVMLITAESVRSWGWLADGSRRKQSDWGGQATPPLLFSLLMAALAPAPGGGMWAPHIVPSALDKHSSGVDRPLALMQLSL